MFAAAMHLGTKHFNLSSIQLRRSLPKNQLRLLKYAKELKIDDRGGNEIRDVPHFVRKLLNKSDVMSKNFIELIMNCKNVVRLEIIAWSPWLSSDALKSIAYLTSLKELVVDNKNMYKRGNINITAEVLSDICTLPLKRCHLLSSSEVYDSCLEKLSHVSTLEELDISSYYCRSLRTNKGIKHLAMLFHLRVLDVSFSSLTDCGMFCIAKLQNLIEFTANYCMIEGETLSCLNDLFGLQVLSLDGNPIGDAGLNMIGQLKQIKCLHLLCEFISDEGVEYLCELKWLEVLYLDPYSVTEEHFEQLESLLPHILWHESVDSDRVHCGGTELWD